MSGHSPSQTARSVAVLRAAHQLLDSAPPVLDDPIILQLIGTEGARSIIDDAAAYQTPINRGLRAHIVLRSRFAEDRLAAAVQRGVRQCVILGAGFDTFAYRQPEWAHALRIIEVDMPAIQTLKRERFAARGIVTPANVNYASVDFERESLRDGLVRNGVSVVKPTFFSWLGVTVYLTEPAVDAVLRTVVAFPADSEIVFTFAQPRLPAPNAPPDAAKQPTLPELAAEAGEPWRTYFDVDALDRKLRTIGFPTPEFLTQALANELYFADRPDGLSAPKRTSIVSARV